MQLDSRQASLSSSKQVLLVQPDVAERQALMLPFEKFGYRVKEASNQFSALKIVESNWLDVVVTDLELSESDGLELPRQIRAKPDRVFPSIVGLTAQPLTAQRVLDAEIAGCDLVVEKPSHPWQFVVRVDQLVRRSRELRQLSSRAQARNRRWTAEAVLIRARAQHAIAHSQKVVNHASVLAVVGRVLTEFLNKPDITLMLDQAAGALDAHPVSCQSALEALVGSGFLEVTQNGYRRRDW